MISDCKIKANALFDEIIFNVKSRFNPSSKYSEKYIIYDLKEEYGIFNKEIQLLKADINSIIKNLSSLNIQIESMDNMNGDFSDILTQIDSFIDSMNNILNLINDLTQDQNQDWVYWLEGTYRNE